MNPDDLKYHKEHTWIKVSGRKATVGITDYAQNALGDIVYIDLPEVDMDFEINSEIGEIESTKATSSIIGAGPGGYVAAIKAAQLGAQVTVIEETEVGGTCLNRGCIPTKSLAASSEMLAKLRQSEDFGIELKGEIIPNLSKIIERKNKIVNTQVKGIRGLFKSWGITLKEGRGVLQSPSEIEVTLKDGSKETTTADKIIIATGSRPSQIPAFPFDGDRIISSNDAINLSDIPKSLLIVGAGVIGCEFACIFKELGSEVSIIEMLPRAVATEDIEISEQLERELKKDRKSTRLDYSHT